MWPDDECVIRVTKPTEGLVGHTLSFLEHRPSQFLLSSPPPPSNTLIPFISYLSSVIAICYLSTILPYFSCYSLLALIRAIIPFLCISGFYSYFVVNILFLFASFILFPLY
jgi:hypothetical protein